MNEKLLRKLAEKERTKFGDLRFTDKGPALAELAAAGLVVETREGRTRLFALTAEGRERAGSPPSPVRAAPRPADDERLARIEAALARIEEALTRLTPSVGAPGDLKAAILGVVKALDEARRYGGLVPLPQLRQTLRAGGVTATDAQVNTALEELERDFIVDLSIAQSPTTVADPAAGIDRPGRGLVYYVVRRRA